MAIKPSWPSPASPAGRPVCSPTALLIVALGGAASTLGLATMAAWYWRWTAGGRIGPDSWPTVLVTGPALALTGSALAGLALGERRLPVVAAGYDLIVGLLGVVGYLDGLGPDIDQLLASDYLAASGSAPGRMSPNAALCYTVIGSGILGSSPWRERRRPLWLALPGIAATVLALVALFGYAAGVPSPLDWGRLSGLPMLSAGGTALLGAALVLLDWDSARESVERALWWIPPAGLLTLLVGAFLWDALADGAEHAPTGRAQWLRAATLLGVLLAALLVATVWLSRRAGTAANARRESEARYRGMMLALGEGIVVQDAEGRIVECNAAAERILGLPRATLTGMTSFAPSWHATNEDSTPLTPDTDPGMVALRTGQPCRGVVMKVRADLGEGRWVIVNTEPLIRPGEVTPYAAVVSFADITDVHRAQEEFRTLAENSPDLIIRYDRDGRRLYANPALAALYHLPAGQLVDHVLADPDETPGPVGCDPDSASLLQQKIRETFDDGRAREFEVVFRAHDGLRFLHVRLVPEIGRDGRVGDVLSLCRDVTELKRVERELAERESRYRAVFDHALDPTFLIEVLPDGQGFRPIELNPAFERSTGFSRSALLGRLTDEMVSPQTAAVMNTHHRRCAETGMPLEDELALDLPVGRRWFRSTLVPVHDVEGRVDRIVGIARDVTQTREAERMVQLLGHALDQLAETVLLMLGDDPHFVYVNAGAATSLGYHREELTGGMQVSDIDPNWTPEVWARNWPEFHAKRRGRFESSHRTKDGRLIPVEVTGSLFEFDGVVVNLAICRDISEHRAAEQALRDSEERFRLAFDDSLVGMALLAPDSVPPFLHLRVNPAMCELVGRTQRDLLGLRLADVLDPDDAQDSEAGLAGLLSGDLSSYRAERRFRRAGGETVWGLFGAALVRDAFGAPLYVLSQVEDITARKRAEKQLVRRALHDDLTGLPNRALLLEHLASALARSQRADSTLAVLFVDLDDFKSINDRFGHGAGDEFLSSVATRISSSVRASDIVARVGGDEFVIVCESLAEPSGAAVVADQIQRSLAAQIPLHGRPVSALASIGIAISQENSTPEDLLRTADAAMYAAKHGGGRHWEPADGFLHAAAMRVLTVEAELRGALERQEFCLRYQPVVDLRSGRVVAVEALLRWQHPERGLVLPGDFLGVAEQRGLIGDIGTWVLQTACSVAAGWHRRFGHAAPHLAVNVSSRQLGSESLARDVRAVLRTSLLPADHLCLELSESQLLVAGQSSTAELGALAEHGVRIAVDDCGSSNAGFEYLRGLPVSELKIDRSFVQDLGTDPTHTAMTAAVIAVGRSLGLTVVAEGVETAEQLQSLCEMGCAWGQGWLWHTNLPPEEVDAAVGAVRRTS
jgi:diguanylate cyclase (GGDEF)-like protein/PAS domain S-box-containing protein